jgi:hypothetical protein
MWKRKQVTLCEWRYLGGKIVRNWGKSGFCVTFSPITFFTSWIFKIWRHIREPRGMATFHKNVFFCGTFNAFFVHFSNWEAAWDFYRFFPNFWITNNSAMVEPILILETVLGSIWVRCKRGMSWAAQGFRFGRFPTHFPDLGNFPVLSS